MTDEITLDAPETRIERFLAAAAGVEGITLDEPKTRIEKYLYKIAQNAGNAPPPITAADDGKVLTANSGVWGAQEPIGKKFIVTCTPSDETFTYGQMDKTVGEIKQAVDAGMEVWFQFTFNENLTGLYACNEIDHYQNATFGYEFVAMFVFRFGDDSFLIKLATSTNSEDSTVWGSTIFPLTHAT